MEIVVNRFLGKTDAVTIYENQLKTVSDKNNVTRAEVEAFYRQNIGGLIAGAVDEEFNKISAFMLDRKYNVVLTRDAKTGQYTLSYERPSVENDDKQISAPPLEALSSAMSRSGDFSTTAFNVVREQDALMPAKTRIRDSKVASSVLFTEIMTGFYTAKTPEDQNRY
jgi:hypothetical protein